jgi:hypothetical protein
MKLVRIAAWILGIYVALGLALDGAIGYFQPEAGGSTAVLRTFDASGTPHDRVLALHDDGKSLWVESGHWFRGWYNRAVANPDVELIRGDQVTSHRAVFLDDPESLEHMKGLMGKGKGAGYYIGRTMLLWAPIRPVRLDPRTAEAGSAS